MRASSIHFHLLLLCFVLLVACESENQPKAGHTQSKDKQAITSDTVSTDPGSTEKEFPRLNNENYEQVLSDYFSEHNERTVKMITNKGEIVIRLYDETPIHSSTFLLLTKRNYFNRTYFTRVVPDFIIQGGSSDQDEIELKRMAIGNFSPLPEFHPDLIHRRGAVSMARGYDNNPDKRSSPFNFFIVVGRTFNTPTLLGIGRDHDKTYTPAHQKIYSEIGGAPHLDGEHTVFGEVVSGMDVVDAISMVETDIREWPIEDIEIIEAVANP